MKQLTFFDTIWYVRARPVRYLKLHPDIIRRREKKYTAKFRHRRKPFDDSIDKKSSIDGFEWTVKFALTLFARAPSNALIVAAIKRKFSSSLSDITAW